MRRRSLKNTLLKTSIYISGIMFLLCASAVDSPSWLPTIGCVISMGWLALVAYANRDKSFEYGWEEGDDDELVA